ncbi:MAG: hypothetical protein JW763_07910 [candidate division Zixibacteria bacterium]|nr:hypothetical protein [candidate division Zixibacteria bacterium]
MRKIITHFLLIGTLILLVALTGCGTLFNGSLEAVKVDANPYNTKVTTQPESGDHKTPTILRLERKNSYLLTFSRNGYESKQVLITRKADVGIVILDVLFTGLIGVIVDATTGAWYNLDPTFISVTLDRKSNTDVIGPDSILVTIKTNDIDKTYRQTVIESDEKIDIDVKCQ